MPIDPNMSHSEIVKELMDSYHKNSKIGNTSIKDAQEAERIANKIAFVVHKKK